MITLEPLLKMYRTGIDQGGFTIKTPNGNRWLAKLAYKDNDRPMILNGHLFAVIGLFDIAVRTGSEAALMLAHEGSSAALEMMDVYDLKKWTAYDRFGKKAPEKYHGIHIEQCKILYRITGVDAYLYWHEKFKSYSAAAS